MTATNDSASCNQLTLHNGIMDFRLLSHCDTTDSDDCGMIHYDSHMIHRSHYDYADIVITMTMSFYSHQREDSPCNYN